MSKLFKLAGCLIFSTSVVVVFFVAAYFYLSGRQNILLLGIDARDEEGDLGRADTMILTTIDSLKPYIGVLSIPRDLWVVIPGVGQNRINTAHFFAEIQAAGDGPYAAMDAVEYNFGIDVEYFARIRFDDFIEFIDKIGGVDISLENAMSGYPVGEHHLDGEHVLAFVRDRSASDDFYRMERGQLLIREVLIKIIDLRNWKLIPKLVEVLKSSVDTNIPFFIYPRLAYSLLRSNPDNIEYKMISREMVTPFITDGGAEVLAPNWELINPMIHEIFGQ